jgi:hypothetical protein
MSKIALSVAAFIAFTGYTVIVAVNHDVFEYLTAQTQGGVSLQVFLDLVVAVACFWIVAVPDARARGIKVWPYLVLSPIIGSIALLGYFVHRSLQQR